MSEGNKNFKWIRSLFVRSKNPEITITDEFDTSNIGQVTPISENPIDLSEISLIKEEKLPSVAEGLSPREMFLKTPDNFRSVMLITDQKDDLQRGYVWKTFVKDTEKISLDFLITDEQMSFLDYFRSPMEDARQDINDLINSEFSSLAVESNWKTFRILSDSDKEAAIKDLRDSKVELPHKQEHQ